MESYDHIQNTIAEIRTTPGTVPEADQLLATTAEAQRTGKMPNLSQLAKSDKCRRCDGDGRVSSRNNGWISTFSCLHCQGTGIVPLA